MTVIDLDFVGLRQGGHRRQGKAQAQYESFHA
jgi:hypothetical protein